MPERGEMTVREAGRLGGEQTFARYGHGHYERIGKMGGEKVRALIEAGREREAEEKPWPKSES